MPRRFLVAASRSQGGGNYAAGLTEAFAVAFLGAAPADVAFCAVAIWIFRGIAFSA
ncbi:MAG: hypothetical protein QOH44_2198, partial [Actinomycetota bacterium]|nr:hypothetical protein [Actinomycetota bacterium]